MASLGAALMGIGAIAIMSTISAYIVMAIMSPQVFRSVPRRKRFILFFSGVLGGLGTFVIGLIIIIVA